ncbi:MAG: hypothetical protein CMP48_02905 [Rickettsiales bacterium]|nr:hypothetical protein [Rickettsiales bacterium]
MGFTVNTELLLKIFRYVLLLAILVLVGKFIATGGFKLGIVLVVVPPVLLFVIFAFKQPQWLMHIVIAMGFLISLLSRYVPGIPFGLSVDGLLGLMIVVLIFDPNTKFESKYIVNGLTISLLVWLIFTCLMLFNPLAKSKEAWFYANRGLSFYPVLLTITTMYIYRGQKHLHAFLIIWAAFAAFGTLWGIKQLILGVSHTEQMWLNAGAASTHILFGKLRVFSYFSDAAQFGASQAHTAVVFGIIGLYPGKMKYRWLYLFIGLFSFYGMLISGTRGALGVIALGGFTYFIMTKNFKIVIAGVLVAGSAFVFLKYTTIMQSNYQVNRMRTALSADDPSLVVRKEREKILEHYLSDKPLGGGIGSAGFWGKRFTPGTFLAEIGTDGHYTRIWMETGVIGLWIYLLMLASIIFYLGTRLWKMEDSPLRQKLVAIYSALLGLCLASYTNGLLTQIPTGILVFIGLAMVYLGTEKELEEA